MRLILASTHYTPNRGSGLDNSIHYLVQALIEKGIEVKTLSHNDPDSDPRINWTPMHKSKIPFSLMFEKDLIHFHLNFNRSSSLFTYILPLLGKENVLFTIQGPFRYDLPDFCLKDVFRYNYFTKVSKWMCKGLNAEYIPNCVNSDLFNPKYKSHKIRDEFGIPEEDFLVLFPGAAEERKGAHLMSQTMKKLDDQEISCIYALPIKGPLSSYLQDNKTDKSFFTGMRSDINILFASVDLVVIPYLSPYATLGTPLSILEAMASGTPVMVSNYEWMTEVVEDNENGFIFNDLAERILEIKDDAAFRKKVGKNGLKTINKEFTPEKVAEKYINIYEEMEY